MSRGILTLNAGSSSIKFALFALSDSLPEQAEVSGQIDGIGTGLTRLSAQNRLGQRIADQSFPEQTGGAHTQAFGHLLHWLISPACTLQIVAIGHRVVHGGERYAHPVLIDETVMTQLAQFTRLAPLHQPHNLTGIRALQLILPEIPNVACFDTAFHRSQPAIAQLYGLPRKFSEEGARRFGFHGLSYEYIAHCLPRHTVRANGRTVVAHLGNGASMSAMINFRCVASTLGFSTIDGLMMGTRCGALDPGLLLHLMESKGLGTEEMTRILYKESGLLGVSGISQDMRTLLASDKPEADEAVDLFCYRIARELGSLAAAAAGVDVLVFTGGIGEHAAEIRRRVCARSAWLGIVLDAQANDDNALKISTAESALEVLVIPTNEEWMIACHTATRLRLTST